MGYAEAKPEATPIQAEDLLHLGDRAAVDGTRRPRRPSCPVLEISEDRVLVQAKGAHDEALIEIYPIERR